MLFILGIAFVLGLCVPHLDTKWKIWDVGLALVVGMCWTAVSCDWFSHFYLQRSTVLYADLIEYCNGVSTKTLLGIGASNKRSAFPMILPRYFYKEHGVFDALSWGAIWGQVWIGAFLYFWGLRLGGRRMGTTILLIALSASPLTLISRTLSSYPAMTACLVFGACCSAWAISSKNIVATWMGGVGIGVALLADTRAIFWGLPWIAGVLIAILCRGNITTKIIRLIVFIHPLWISHTWASQFYVFDAIGLESQVDIRPALYHWLKIYPPPYDYPSNYTWGLRPLSQLPKTLGFLWEQYNLEVPEILVSDMIMKARERAQYEVWIALAGLLMGMWKHRRNGWMFFALGTSTFPFLLAHHSAVSMLEEHTRFYIQTLPGVVVLWAMLWEGMVDVGSTMRTVLFPRLGWQLDTGADVVKHLWKGTMHLLYWIPAVVLAQLVLGGIDSTLSPVATWRRTWEGNPDDFASLLSHYESGEMAREPNPHGCFIALQRNTREKRPQRSTVYDTSLWSQWNQKYIPFADISSDYPHTKNTD